MCARFVSRGAPFHAFHNCNFLLWWFVWPFFFSSSSSSFFSSSVLLKCQKKTKKKKQKERKSSSRRDFLDKKKKKKTVHEEEIKMAGKAKPKKHTAKELKQKQDAALTNKGGGKAGLQDRKGGAAGHAKFKCPVCGMAAPSLKSGELHWDSKHAKLPFKPEDWSDLHAMHGGTTKGVAVKGAEKEKTIHELKKTEAGRKRLAELEKEKLEKQFQEVKIKR